VILSADANQLQLLRL